MNPLIHLARLGFHPSFGYHPYHAYGYGYGHAFGGGIGHMIVSAVIHAMIYSAIFRLFSHLSLGAIVLIVVAVIVVLYALNRNTRYQRW
jgi:hypothetical protein